MMYLKRKFNILKNKLLLYMFNFFKFFSKYRILFLNNKYY